MIGMFEGAIAKGVVKGKFGRLLSAEGDVFLGYMTGDPVEGAWNANGKGVWYQDMELMAMGVWQADNARGLGFDEALWYDEENPDKFVYWDFWSFEREDIPYDVMYDEESGCRWNDGSCLYWAYQYSAWGTLSMPDRILQNKYYIAGGAVAE
jgi:hypothetical protein